MEQNPQKPSKSKHDHGTLMVVTELKTYQPVEWGKQLEKFFTARRPGMAGLTMQFDWQRQIIIIKQDGKKTRTVMPSNVEYMEIEGV